MSEEERNKAIDKLGYDAFGKCMLSVGRPLRDNAWKYLYPYTKALFTEKFIKLSNRELMALLLSSDNE